jgi:hypothetical protein
MVRIEVISPKDRFIFDWEGEAPITVGRLPSCDVPVPSTDVSREHCRIGPGPSGGWKVLDLGSKNGVHVNGRKVEECALALGDEIRLCPEVTLRFGERAAAPEAKGAAPLAAPAGQAGSATAAAPDSAEARPPDPAEAPAAAPPSGEGPAAPPAGTDASREKEETPAERARRLAAARARERSAQSRVLLGGILLVIAAVGYGAYAYLLAPGEAGRGAAGEGAEPAAAVASAPAGAEALPGLGARPASGATSGARREEDAEREWARLEALDLEPELLAGALDAFARRYPASPRAREASARASSLRRVAAGGGTAERGGTAARPGTGGGASAGPAAALGALEGEVDSLVREGSFPEARFLASSAARLFGAGVSAQERLLRRVDQAAFERFQAERERARELAQREGRPLDGLARAAAVAEWARRFPFAREAEAEAAAMRAVAERAIASAAAVVEGPGGGSGDRSLLEKLVPEAKRATVACDFDTALDRWAKVLELPLTERERLDAQWRIFDLRRARELFRELLLRIAATAAGGKDAPPPIEVTITQAIKGKVIDGDANGVKIALEIPGESKKNLQLYERRWKDLTPLQVLEIFRGLTLDGDGLLALAAYCFEAEYELDAHACLVESWERFPVWRAEAASLLRRRTGVAGGVTDMVAFEGRLVSKVERQRILDGRAAAKAEAERIAAEVAAAKKEASGTVFLERAITLIEAGDYVEGRAALARIASRWKDVEAGKKAQARLDDALLRRRTQRKSGRDENRVSIVCMAEGYPVERNEDQRAFDGAADRTKAILEKCDLWKEYDGWFNYHAMNLWSRDRGVDREPGGIVKETPLGGRVQDGTFTIQNALARAFLDRYPGPSVGVAIGNDNASVATGGGGACAIAKGMVEVAGHEIGHAFAALGDEYDMDPGTSRPSGPGGRSKDPLPTRVIAPNLIGGNQKDELRKQAPWAHWIALGAANWTGKVVDIFEGGNQTPFDVWRPQSDCRMRTSSSGFCVACMEQMVVRLYGAVRPIDEVDPKDEALEVVKGESAVLKAVCLRPKSRPLDAVWTIGDVADSAAPDGSTVVVAKKAKRLENVSETDLPDGRRLYGAKVTATPGLYEVTLTVSDPTPWVAQKDRSALSEKRVWRLRVRDRARGG